ncbi:MAG: PAS-domain containing protein [Notoacmeibacter sp.]|nr:PAS-domain containing protein [Notoacmeibacter sp.]MCC0031625.1 PAS-domain containing protein [Brucellaceae bacterium]
MFSPLRARRAATVPAGGAALLSFPEFASAQASAVPVEVGSLFGVTDVISYSVFAGVLGAAIISAIYVIRERARISEENAALRSRISDLNAALQRNEGLLNLKDQRLVVWAGKQTKPELTGSLPAECGAPDERSAFLAFGRWLTPASAASLERAVIDLRDKDRAFDMVLESRTGALLEAEGRIAPHHTVVRFSSLTEARSDHARTRAELQNMSRAFSLLSGLASRVAAPMWVRDTDGRLTWVNAAYAQAVEAASPDEAVAQGRELLATQTRETVSRAQLDDPVYAKRVSTVIGKERHQFLMTDCKAEEGSAGIALDITGMELLREEYEHAQRSHSDTLDQLNTAVAIFDADKKLRFYNLAFQKLWDLDTGFLSSAPDHTLLLDRLRSDGILPEQPEWRRWKDQLFSAYHSVDSQEHWWHLPDGRTIRVLANPQPKGGVTWVFENLTERIDLESRYNTAVRVQGETLDNLAEGVAVFGPDGKVRLCNPAFATLWGLPEELARENVHISAIRGACEPIAKESPWNGFVSMVTGFDEERAERSGRTALADGTILSWAAIPLPNGQVMTTFVDVTDSANVERALKDKNDALQKADQLKDEFVQNVSYELRSPLTNIIGFTELLAMGAPGPLTPKQRDYVDHIATSSSLLLTIVNDILDLATVDAGIMQLDITDMPLADTVQAAADLVADRFAEEQLVLTIDLGDAPAALHADQGRVRQILFNLLSNAANHAPSGSTVSITARREGAGVLLAVHDDGAGMSPQILETVFQRFSSGAGAKGRRGAGLGLSIVKSFMELHGGSVSIETGQGGGTTVTCHFPLAPDGWREAAE